MRQSSKLCTDLHLILRVSVLDDLWDGELITPTGKGLANPTALLLSSLMMLRCVVSEIDTFLPLH